MSLKFPYFLKGPAPAKPERGISGDLAIALATRLGDASQAPMNEKAQRYMAVAIEAAVEQEQGEWNEWHDKMAEYRKPIELDPFQVLAVGFAVTAVVVVVWALWTFAP